MSKRDNSCRADKPSLGGHLYGLRLHSARAGIGGITQLHTGGAVFCVSNASKSGTRLLIFDDTRNFMSKGVSGKMTMFGNIMDGLCASVTE